MAALTRPVLRAVCLLTLVAVVCVHCKPMGGKYNETIYSMNATDNKNVNGTCHTIGFFQGGSISIKGTIKLTDLKESDKDDTVVNITFRVFKLRCANYLDMGQDDRHKICGQDNLNLGGMEEVLFAQGSIKRTFSLSADFTFEHNMTQYATPPATHPAPPVTSTATDAKLQEASPVTTEFFPTTSEAPPTPTSPTHKASSSKSKREEKKPSDDMKVPKGGYHGTAVGINTTGVYLIQILVYRSKGNNSADTKVMTTNVQIELHNRHGYLSAIDYPALVFYGIMTAVYAIYCIAWIVMMMCSFKDLVRLQFWVLAVIILGFLEKTFFVAEYSAINLGNDTYGSYLIAEFVSAVKRGLSRMLLIIVAMGFGTVKPRLGDSLFKVVAAGVAYFSLALVDGIMRSRTNTFHTNNTSSVVTLALLLVLDFLIFYWIFTAIVDTRRTLRLRKNFTKLTMYNHFAYTLIFAITATIAFTVWVIVDLEYPSEQCLTDWREVWLRDCFWHVLFAFILVVIMVIWRPSTNRNRFAYSLVTEADDEEEVVFEQGNNKNFDTVKMRSLMKSTSDPLPPVTSQVEDDLRWVEENLPTTAMDKALPLLLDSDEEVMTTKFEVSKMN